MPDRLILYFRVFSASALLLLSGLAGAATYVVDGVGGGGNYATIQAAVDAASVDVSSPVVDIQTNGPLAGFTGSAAAAPMTIKAGTGFSPVINTACSFTRVASNALITLEDLTINLPAGATSGYGLTIDRTVTFRDCVITSLDSYAVTCGYSGTAAIDDIVRFEQCSLSSSATTALTIMFRGSVEMIGGIIQGSSTNGGTLFHNNAYVPQGNLTLEGVTIDAGPTSGFGMFCGASGAEAMGALKATNCLFLSNLSWEYGNNVVNKYASMQFRHCTFRMRDGKADVNGGNSMIKINAGPQNYTFSNCLFDAPNYYGIATVDAGDDTAQGTNNTFNMTQSHTYVLQGAPWTVVAPFDTAAIYTASTNVNALCSDATGHLTILGGVFCGAKGATLIPSITTDIDGEARSQPVATNPDTGADESTYVPVELAQFGLE